MIVILLINCSPSCLVTKKMRCVTFDIETFGGRWVEKTHFNDG